MNIDGFIRVIMRVGGGREKEKWGMRGTGKTEKLVFTACEYIQGFNDVSELRQMQFQN